MEQTNNTSTRSGQTSLSLQNDAVLQEATPAQRKEITGLLNSNKLPASDLAETVKLYALTYQDKVVGSAGLELYGNNGLLRSVSVDETFKGKGWGKFISHEAENIARKKGITALYLVTTTAESFFGKLGYRSISRNEVPGPLLVSAQFNGICPTTAAIMLKVL